MEGRPRRRLRITVRAAADLTASPSKPYVVLRLGDQKLLTGVTRKGGSNPVWDETVELLLPPPLPNEQPLQVSVAVKNSVFLLPDRQVASGTTPLSDLLYGGGRHEVTVPLHDEDGKQCGHMHLGLEMETEAQPGEVVESALGTVLGEVHGGKGPGSPLASAAPGSVLPSSDAAEMQASQAREVLGAGNLMDPSKPAFGLMAPDSTTA